VLGAILIFSVGLHVTVELPARKFLRGLLSLRPGSPLARLLGRGSAPDISDPAPS
jgi:hypothetical protein